MPKLSSITLQRGAKQLVVQEALETTSMKGVVSELAEKYGCTQTIFAGFLDGVNDSLNNKFTDEELEAVSADTAIDLDIDFRTLLFNMEFRLQPVVFHIYRLSPALLCVFILLSNTFSVNTAEI